MPNLECRVFPSNCKYSFDIVDLDDTLEYGDEVLPECLYTSTREYANDSTAERNGANWIKRFNKSSEAERRKLCGFDAVTACRVVRRSVPVLRKASVA